MSSITDRRMTWPTRDDLRAASPWVWVLLAIALADFVLGVWDMSSPGINLVAFAAVRAVPAVLAATLMYVAPRERLVRIAAFAFVIPVILDELRSVVSTGATSIGSIGSDYALLIPRLMEWTSSLYSIAAVFTAVAIVALALHIGPIKTTRGWFIVAVAAVLAGANLVSAIASWLPILDAFAPGEFPLTQLALLPLYAIVGVCWGYFLAVATDRRLWLLAGGAAAILLDRALLLVAPTGSGTEGPTVIIDLALWLTLILSVVAWIALLTGVLLQLPRWRNQAAEQVGDATMSRGAFSPGQ